MAQGIVLTNKSVDGSVGQENPLPVVIKDGTTGNDAKPTAVGDGNVTTTAGTAKKLIATSTPCKRVVVHAVGGHIVVGGSTCVYAEGTRRGTLIHKTQKESFNIDDVSKIYVDSASNVLVSFYYEN